MRLPYFPDLAPGELLYSLLARHGRHVAAPGPSGPLDLLFGRRTTIATVDLPGHVADLAARLDPALGLTAHALIDRATLYPYYAAHQPRSVRRVVRACMLEGNASTLHHRLGVPAFRVPRPEFLRYCPECLAEQIRQGGEARWLRLHQAPGALVCHMHRILLRDSTVRPSTASRHGFVPAGPEVCPHHASGTDGMGAAASDVLMALASRTEELLSGSAESRDLTEWGGIYRERLEAVGLMRSRHKVDQVRLSDALSDFYAGVLRFLPPACARLGPGGWPEQIVRAHRKAFHPLLHLMLQAFLDQSSDAVSPFGRGPWPCLNPLPEHRGELVIDALDRHRNRDTLVGVFSCRCGYVYTRCLRANGRLDLPRMQAVGPLFGPALRRLLVPGCTLRGVANALGVDPKTLMREAASLGVPVGWRTAPSGKPRPPSRPVEPPSRKAGHRRLASPGKPRRDWPTLDQRLVDRLEREAGLVLNVLPPMRVNLAELERRLGVRGWLRKRAAKLPLSNAAAARLTETIEAFRRRRVRHVITLPEFAHAPEPWRVMRSAGLSGSDLPMIRQEIEQRGFSRACRADRI